MWEIDFGFCFQIWGPKKTYYLYIIRLYIYILRISCMFFFNEMKDRHYLLVAHPFKRQALSPTGFHGRGSLWCLTTLGYLDYSQVRSGVVRRHVRFTDFGLEFVQSLLSIMFGLSKREFVKCLSFVSFCSSFFEYQNCFKTLESEMLRGANLAG